MAFYKPQRAPWKGLEILVVDDLASKQDNIERMVVALGAEVAVKYVGTILEAEQYLRSKEKHKPDAPVDLIIMDYNLPYAPGERCQEDLGPVYLDAWDKIYGGKVTTCYYTMFAEALYHGLKIPTKTFVDDLGLARWLDQAQETAEKRQSAAKPRRTPRKRTTVAEVAVHGSRVLTRA